MKNILEDSCENMEIIYQADINCFVCKELNKKLCSSWCGQLSCLKGIEFSFCDRVNNLDNNRCVNCGAKAGHSCQLNK